MTQIGLLTSTLINPSLTSSSAKFAAVRDSLFDWGLELTRDAKECDYCDKLFCKLCIENWLVLNRNCPMCHRDIKIRGASRVVKEVINSFKIKCSFCPKVVPLVEIETHEQQCG